MKTFQFAYDIRQWLLSMQGVLSLPVCVRFVGREWTVTDVKGLYVIQDNGSGARAVL